jgi:hypothetical protein
MKGKGRRKRRRVGVSFAGHLVVTTGVALLPASSSGAERFGVVQVSV